MLELILQCVVAPGRLSLRKLVRGHARRGGVLEHGVASRPRSRHLLRCSLRLHHLFIGIIITIYSFNNCFFIFFHFIYTVLRLLSRNFYILS